MMEASHREILFADLESADAEVRRLAVERLTLLPASEAIPVLVEKLGDPDWRVRKVAIARLTATPETSGAIPALIEALADGRNPGRRNAALEALTRCGLSALPLLLEASHDPDVDVRKQVVDALAGIGDPSAAPRLCELLGDADVNVRGAAAEALGSAGGELAVDRLAALVREDREPLVRLSALRTLDRLEVPVPTEDLRGCLEDPMLRSAALALLAHSDDPGAARVLLKGLESGGRSSRDAALQALVRLCVRLQGQGDGVLGVHERLRTDGSRAEWDGPLAYVAERACTASLATRLAAVQLLGLVGDPRGVPALLQAGCDEALTEVSLGALAAMGTAAVPPIRAHWVHLSSGARQIACRFLAEMPGDVSRELLLEALRGGDFELRAAAARAVGRHGDVEVIPDLLDLLAMDEGIEAGWREDEDRAAAAEALESLGRRAPGEVCRALGERLGREGQGFRLASARILRAIGGPEELPTLELLASDPDPAVRRAAVEGMATVSGHPPLDALRLALADEDPGVRIGAARALAQSDEPSVLDDLSTLAEDPEARVRAAALHALGDWSRRIGEPHRDRVFGVISQALALGGTPAMAGLQVLGELGGAAAVALATSMLGADDAELVESAVSCIARHADREVLLDLLPLLSHEHWSVRGRVVEALAERVVTAAIPAILRQLERESDEFVRGTMLTALDRLE